MSEAMTINEQVATKVMGWEWKPPYEISFGGTNPEWPCRGAWQAGLIYVEVFDPEHSIADAWLVVYKLRGQGWRFQLIDHGGGFMCILTRGDARWEGVGPDAEYAICLASLKAVEEG